MDGICSVCNQPLTVNDKMGGRGEWAGMCRSCVKKELEAREAAWKEMTTGDVLGRGQAVHIAGAPDARPGEAARLVVTRRAICLGAKSDLRWRLTVPLPDIKQMNVLTAEQVSALRVIALGLLGALLKTKQRYLDVTWDLGGLETHLVLGGVSPEQVIAAVMKARTAPGDA
jgi:hypothetical protein